MIEKPNQKKLQRLKRLKIPHKVVGNIIVIEGDPRQKVVAGGDNTSSEAPDTVRPTKKERIHAPSWVHKLSEEIAVDEEERKKLERIKRGGRQ